MVAPTSQTTSAQAAIRRMPLPIRLGRTSRLRDFGRDIAVAVRIEQVSALFKHDAGFLLDIVLVNELCHGNCEPLSLAI